MANQFTQVQEQDGVLTITMDDPKTRNALGAEMNSEIEEALDRLERDPDLRVLLLTGRDPAFCSGANVRRFRREIEEREQGREEEPERFDPWARMEATQGLDVERSGLRFLPLRLHKLRKPSIAAVNGYAMGIGMGLALSCDIRIASENARFSEAFIRNGLVPADGSCWQLPRLVGLSNTLLLQYTGDMVDGKDAYRIGLCSKVVPHEAVMAEAMALATRLAQGPTYAMSLTKYLVHKSLFVGLEESLRLAGPAQALAHQTEDHKEGVQAFLEKRKPVFKGR